MVDIKRGQTDKNAASEQLLNFFRANSGLNGKVYVGYPILYTGGENIVLDALWISEEYGVVVFDLVEGREIKDRTDERDIIYTKLESLLRQYTVLNKGRKFLVQIEVVTYAPVANGSYNYTATNDAPLMTVISSLNNWDTPELFKQTVSVIQSVVQLKAKVDRSYVKQDKSKGAIIKRLEETIANLDEQQEAAVIEYHDGIQRIRGLAGSGKTIVLALKAAYLHAMNPDWNIAVTFNTRALKNQFNELIELFCIQKMGRKPNEDKIKVLHAWGGSSSPGIYYEFCIDNNVDFLDFRSARARAGGKPALDYACNKALADVQGMVKSKYDIILVDEAQDLSESFLRLCFGMLTEKKRLIYAYDELQKLNEGSSLPSPKIIFGREASDTILEKCYRNSKPVLVTAHALGFGIYKEDGLVQFFDQPDLWKDVGYSVKSGALKAGKSVVLDRKEEATHTFLEQEISNEDLISFRVFDSKEDQAKIVAQEIHDNLKSDELLHRDIVVINPMALTTKEEVGVIRALLNRTGIKSHIAGDTNKDWFFEKDSITFTGINRAKGNEVPMVYIINAHDCYSHPYLKNLDLITRRNILFTAITRSKAWVRVFGIGDRMNSLIKEFEQVKKHNFELHFTYPTPEEIQKMNIISRDISKDEEIQIKEEIKSLTNIQLIIERIKSGEAHIEDYPTELHFVIEKLLEDEN